MALAPACRALLVALREGAPLDVFNQYAQIDPALDRPDGAARRLANLARYLQIFARPRYVIVGEAAGYAGCRFTGIPFTDEVQLVGPAPLPWAGAERGFQRSSHPERPLLREASAAAVWSALGARRDVALWNVVPWHPTGRRGALSNGRPSPAARAAGLVVLKFVLEHVWPQAAPCAAGRLAERALGALGIPAPYLRHPSHGGQTAFRSGLAAACPPAPDPVAADRYPRRSTRSRSRSSRRFHAASSGTTNGSRRSE